MERTHYTMKPVGPLREVKQPDVNSESFKPHGLWYGVNGEWEEWCRSEMPEWITGGMLYAVRFGSEKVLRIESLDALDAFHAEYHRTHPQFSLLGYIDWPTVATRYDGIEIAPYQWQRRLEPGWLWYYGWDCASGCIWRPKGMTLELVRDESRAAAVGEPG